MIIEFGFRPQQMEVYNNLKRFNVLLAHRRMGKTVFALMLLVLKALECKHKNPVVHYYCPTYSQAKKVAWSYLKQFTFEMGAEYNEAELKCTLPTGAVIQLGSADNPDNSRGIYSDFCVLDEPSNMQSRMWTEILRPALSDRLGGALFIGTPAGEHGLFYEMYELAGGEEDWFRGKYKASETGVIPDTELQAAQKVMSRAEYDQEYEVSFSAAVKGAYFGETMAKLKKAGSITVVRHDTTREVYCSFDLGMSDACAVWFFQIQGNEYQFIDYVEYTNTGLPDIVAHMKQKPYNYGQWVFPFDVDNQSLSTGKTRKRTLQELGVDVVVAKKMSIIDRIELGRSMLNRCIFDAVKCKAGIECLRQFKSEWDDKNGTLRLRPLHNWASHGSDSFTYCAVADLAAILGSWGSELEYSDSGRH